MEIPILTPRNQPTQPYRSRLCVKSLGLISFTLLATWYLLPFAFPLNSDALSGPSPSTLILDRHGEPLHHQPRPDSYRHLESPLEGIPQQLIDATLAAEDKRFFMHAGVDSLATLRALKDSLQARRFVSGASTITQQTVKLTSGRPPRTLKNKVIEALTARHLEMTVSKEEILACYFNHLDYGNLTQGPRQAALHYFAKELDQLSLAENALLAGLPQAPSRHNPRRNPTGSKKRRDWVLMRMQQLYHIPADEIQRALAEPIQLVKRKHVPDSPQLALMAMRYRSSESRTVQTTIDQPLQQFVERTLQNELAKLTQKNVHNAAAVVIHNSSREVRALVGTADFDSQNAGQINAALTPRSPGSALKPFTYLLAFEESGFTPATILADIPTRYAGPRGPEEFVNYDRSHRGPVSIYQALGNSLNVPAVRTLNQLGGPAPLLKLLNRLGFDSLNLPADDYGLALTLGSGEVTLLEITNAYATIARLGNHRPSKLFSRHNNGSEKAIFSPTSAYLLSSIMADNLARSESFGTHSSLRLPFFCAVKTGTSSDFRDNFCVGFTADYTVGIWVGNLDNTPMKGISGVTGAGPALQQIFTHLHRNQKPIWPAAPNNVVAVHIDPNTGKNLPHGHPRSSNALHTFTPRHALPATAAESDYDHTGRVYLDARYSQWIKDNPHRPFTATPIQQVDLTLRVLSPSRDATYLLDPDLPDRGTYLPLQSNSDLTTSWSCHSLNIIDHHGHPTLILSEGTHRLTATCRKTGQRQIVTFSVKKL